jgi:zinc transporter 9
MLSHLILRHSNTNNDSSFLAGSLPLSFSLSQRQMRLISAVGTGLLVGTALIVIIPEGIETLYSAETSTQTAVKAPAPARGAGAVLSLHTHSKPEAQRSDTSEFIQHAEPVMIRRTPIDSEPLYPDTFLYTRATPAKQTAHEETSSHAWIGVSLVTGFILMYLIDVLPTLSTPPGGHHIPLATLNGDTPTTPIAPPTHSHSHSTTIGLVIHSFADGIALGASSATPSTQNTLGLIVFVAILVHKAPAAFGLTAVLLKQGVSKRAARGHLLVFSLAAPFGALATWAFVNLLGKVGISSSGANAGAWWTGIVLIFSGGTFL